MAEEKKIGKTYLLMTKIPTKENPDPRRRKKEEPKQEEE